MIAILNRWRQFGRRYFWPHLLLGIVAASFGSPVAPSAGPSAQAANHSGVLNIAQVVQCDGSILPGRTHRYSCRIDYWHQHAIRRVIRRLSFTMLGTIKSKHLIELLPGDVQKLVLLDTLNVLLTHEFCPKNDNVIVFYPATVSFTLWQAGLWLAQVQGTRSDPSSFCS
ncbi:secA translation cis-regulator SecM [Enterobacteriaceae bacterium LUAb1]